MKFAEGPFHKFRMKWLVLEGSLCQRVFFFFCCLFVSFSVSFVKVIVIVTFVCKVDISVFICMRG